MTDATLNRFLSRGSNAQRLAFTPSPPTPGSGPSPTYIWYETDTGNTYAYDGAAWNQVNTATGTTSLSTAISTVDSNQSTSISQNLSKINSLSTAVSTVDSNQSTSLSQISSSLSGAISSTSSLSSAVSTVISGSISTVTSSVNSLSTAIGGGSSALTLISSQTVAGSAVASVSFTSISGSYNDLIVVCRVRGTAAVAASQLQLQLNGDTTANYDYDVGTFVNATTSVTTTLAQTVMRLGPVSGGSAVNSNRFGSAEVRILQYANTSFEKDVMTDLFDNASHTAATMRRTSSGGTWRSTAAVNRIDFLMDSGNIEIGSTFYLYGRT